MSEAEEIKKCLNCKKPECTNCVSCVKTNGRGQRFLYEGEMRTVAEIADMIGFTRAALYDRIRLGGFDFAVSGVRRYKTWLKQKEVGCE